MKIFYKKNVSIFFLAAKKKEGKKILVIIGFLVLSNIAGIAQNASYRRNSIPISGTNCSAFGYKALFSNTLGSWNVANGYTALSFNTTGDNNTATGARALYSNTTGNANTATGARALYSNTIGNNNTANGVRALYSNTTGYSNTANGVDALYSNTTGNENTASGYNALFSNTTGEDNTANGFNALGSNIYGVRSTAIGANALAAATSGWDNTALGMNALRLNINGTTNTATGTAALYFNTSGWDNTANGAYALMSNTTGHYNTAIGNEALKHNVTGSNNTGLGFRTGVAMFSGPVNNSTAVGAYALVNTSNKVRLGDAGVTVVEGPVFYTVSDERFKNNVSEKDVKGLEFIKLLRPVVYNFDTKKFQKFLTMSMPDSIGKKYMDKEFALSTAIRQSGFIAQEVEKAALETGYDFNGVHTPETENDNYSLGYSQFVVPLVKGMQEQQQMIEKQQQQLDKQQQEIDELRKAVAGFNTSSGSEGMVSNDIQIYPNPGKGIFIIRTKGVETGIIEVVNLEGKIIYETEVTNNTSDYKIDLSAYPRGIYLLTISSNGKEITSRKLMIE